MSRRDYIIEVIAKTANVSKPIAESVLERLNDEGVLHLGYGNAEIDQVVEKFADTFGTTKTSKYDRFATARLVKKYGAQAVIGVIGLLGQLSDQPYAPVAGNIVQLEEKWVSILSFLRKQGEKGETIDV